MYLTDDGSNLRAHVALAFGGRRAGTSCRERTRLKAQPRDAPCGIVFPLHVENPALERFARGDGGNHQHQLVQATLEQPRCVRSAGGSASARATAPGVARRSPDSWPSTASRYVRKPGCDATSMVMPCTDTRSNDSAGYSPRWYSMLRAAGGSRELFVSALDTGCARLLTAKPVAHGKKQV